MMIEKPDGKMTQEQLRARWEQEATIVYGPGVGHAPGGLLAQVAEIRAARAGSLPEFEDDELAAELGLLDDPVKEHGDHDQRTHGRRKAGLGQAREMVATRERIVGDGPTATATDVAMMSEAIEELYGRTPLDLSKAERYRLGGGITGSELWITEDGAYVAKGVDDQHYQGGSVMVSLIDEGLGLGASPGSHLAVGPDAAEVWVVQEFEAGVLGHDFLDELSSITGRGDLYGALRQSVRGGATADDMLSTGIPQALILDTITGQQDRHSSNLLYERNHDSPIGFTMRLIDNGLVMEVSKDTGFGSRMSLLDYDLGGPASTTPLWEATFELVRSLPDYTPEQWVADFGVGGGSEAGARQLAERMALESYARYRRLRGATNPVDMADTMASILSRR